MGWSNPFNAPQENTDSLGPPPSGLPPKNKPVKKKTPATTAKNAPKGYSSAGQFRVADAKAGSGVDTNLGNDTGAPVGGGIDGVDPATMALLMSMFGSGGSSDDGGGGGSSKASMVNAANQLAWDKKKFRMEQGNKQQQELYDRQVTANQNTKNETALQNQRTGLDEYLATLQSQINAGPSGYGQKQEALKTQLGGIYNTAKSTIGSSQADLEKSLAAMVNPFAGYQAQAAPTFNTANLQQLLMDNQVGTDPLQRLAGLQQNENASQATAFQNMMNTLGGVYQGSMNDRLANAKQGSTYASNQADMNKAALMSQLSGEQSDILEKLKQALLQGRLQRSQIGK